MQQNKLSGTLKQTRGGGGARGKGGVGLHLFLFLEVPFYWPRNIFLVAKPASSQPVCFPFHHFYFQIIIHFFTIFVI